MAARWIAIALLALGSGTAVLGQVASGASADPAKLAHSVSWVEEWNPATQSWERVSDVTVTATADEAASELVSTDRLAAAASGKSPLEEPLQSNRASGVLAQFGAFRVQSPDRAVLVGSTNASSPRDFDAMLSAFPKVAIIEFADASGTTNDLANLAVGRKIRAAGLTTYVPAGGSARSGAVELFLAGSARMIDPQAMFAVHSWRDERGREPHDFAADAPANRLYIDYYIEMGMSVEEARAFYAMTNSVPHSSALWLSGSEMETWLPGPKTFDKLARSRTILAAR